MLTLSSSILPRDIRSRWLSRQGQRVAGDFEMRKANFQIIKKGKDKTGEDEWKVDLAGSARWLLSVC